MKLSTFVLGVALCVAQSSIFAAPIFTNTNKGLPDIESTELTVDYQVNSTSSSLLITGLGKLQNLANDAVDVSNPYVGDFSVSLDFDVTDPQNPVALLTGSVFQLTSNVAISGNPPPPGVVLAGSVIDFGFSGTTFEFLLDITSGSEAANFGSNPGVIVSGDFSAFDFGIDFFDATNNLADTFVVTVPVPSTLSLFVLAMAGFLRYHRRK